MLAFAFLLLAAQEPPRLEETIVVTAERLEQRWEESAAAVTVLRRDDLERMPAANLGELLPLVPGLQLLAVNPGAPPMISSRGFFGAGEVEYLQLLIDGVPVGDAESGLADWRSVPVTSIDRIEILRGAGSSLFGDTALGGVVQVFRREVTHASLTAGSFGALHWSGAGVWPSVSEDARTFSAAADFVRSDGFRAHSGSEEQFARVSWDRGHLRYSLDASHRRRDDPGALDAQELADDYYGSDPLFDADEEESRRVRGAIRYRDESLEVLLYANDRNSDQTRTLLLAPGFGDTARRELDTRGAGALATKTFTLKRGRLATGVDFDYETLESAYFAESVHTASGDGSRRKGALFASGEWNVTRAVRVAAGGRWDAIEDEFARGGGGGTPPGQPAGRRRSRAFSPRVGASFDLGALTAYVQWSHAFKAPTLDQRFDVRPLPDFAGGTFTISNPDLVPQRSKNAELGLRGGGRRYEWEASGYAINVEDEIDFDLRTFRYANIGRSRHRGLETMVVVYPTPSLAARLTYAWTRVRQEEFQLKNIAEHVARLGIDFRSGVDVHLEIERSASRFLDDENRFPLDDATVVDLRLARTFGVFTAAIDGRNLLDRHYAPLGYALGDTPLYYPAEGRSVACTITWNPRKGADP
jgi:iron complex outermembrane receptor protein